MLVVEFWFGSPILQEAVSQAPETEVVHEEIYKLDGRIRHLFWGEGGDLASLEDGITDDPTVTNLKVLTDAPDRRLYRVDFTEEGKTVATFPSWSELDIVLLQMIATDGGWEARMRIPDRESLVEYTEICEEQDIPFELKCLYKPETISDEAEGARRYGVTPSQREALLEALESGYFAVPRETTLQEIADELDVSTQAVSTRLRRGQQGLLRHTLAH